MMKKSVIYILSAILVSLSNTANAGLFTGVKVLSADGSNLEFVNYAADTATQVLLVIPEKEFIEIDEDDNMVCDSLKLKALLESHEMALLDCWSVLHQFAVTYNPKPVIQLFYQNQINNGVCFSSGDGQLECEDSATNLVLKYMVFTSEHFNNLDFIQHSVPDFPLEEIQPIVDVD